MRLIRKSRYSSWHRHGYIFFVLFGGLIVGTGMLVVRWLGIPEDVPLNGVIYGYKALWLIPLLALIVIFSYLVSLFISDMIKEIVAKMWRDIPWL